MAALVLPAYVVLVVAYGASPEATDVGYMPEQPVPYSHALHAGEMGMDCRYCHVAVETTPHATIPSTKICVNCHAHIFPNSDKLAPVRKSWSEGTPVEWVRVHDLPDYAYFNHSAHVGRVRHDSAGRVEGAGIGCATCHGRIDKMATVYQAAPLSMGWCLECHRNPEKYLRPIDRVTDMTYTLTPEEQLRKGLELKEQFNVNPSTDCSTCHR